MIRRALSFAAIVALGACAHEPTVPVLDDIEPGFARVTAGEECLALAQRLDAKNLRIGERTASRIDVEVSDDGLTTSTTYVDAAWTASPANTGTRTVTKDSTGEVVSVSWNTAFTHRSISWSSDGHATVESWRRVDALPTDQPPLKICSV